MGVPAIRAEGIGKRYRMRRVESGYRRLGQAVRREDRRWLWALRDVGFEIEEGVSTAIVGRNGAGKSTLLKLLSRITEPTEGYADIAGRVGALLEVGTGFHPELTGRENVYFNGAILGMRKAEIDRKFDQIVEFSGVGEHIDKPIKWYSSGMGVRLGFAVAAHLEPEILIVDEVLAVGDAEFQQKCLGKMKDVTREGRTVVFVSHRLPAVRSLCSRALVLEKGVLAFEGDPDGAIHHYLGHGGDRSGAAVDDRELALRLTRSEVYGDTPALRCDRVAVLDETGLPCSSFRSNEEITVAVDYAVLRPVPSLRLIVTLRDEDQTPVLRTESADDEAGEGTPVAPGSYRSLVTLPRDLLGDARLDLDVALVSEVHHVLEYSGVVELDVRFAGLAANMRGGAYLRPALHWRTEAVDRIAAARAG